jgi:indolepyruvate ferredoxin oxidoreductase alpha subunit
VCCAAYTDSHARGNVRLGTAYGGTPGRIQGRRSCWIPAKARPEHARRLQARPSNRKNPEGRDLFEQCPFNTYEGPERPEILIVTSSACTLYSREAVHALDLRDRVGILKLATTWPLPPNLLKKHLARTGKVLVVEEVLAFLEENVKVIAA